MGSEKKFSAFVDEFLKDYDKNLLLCKEWVNECHSKLMDRVDTKNSFFEIIIPGLLHNTPINVTKKLL